MADLSLNAELREVTTKGAVNQLRRDGFVPGVLYSHDMEPVVFSVPELSLKPVVYTTEMHLIDVKVGKNEPVKSILKDVQFDPLTDRIIHVDFQAITVGQAIQVQVPVNLVGQAIGVKEGGRLYQNLHKFDIECLPKDIPQHLEIEITNLHVGDAILVKDVSFENITILNPLDTNVVSVIAAREEEVEETTDELLEGEELAEPEVISKGKQEEDTEG
jgi:large subunit ribosomal protein L25